jgi:hypothetical protein
MIFLHGQNRTCKPTGSLEKSKANQLRIFFFFHLSGSNLSWTNFEVLSLLSQNLTASTEENHEKPVMTVGNLAEILTECLSNTN